MGLNKLLFDIVTNLKEEVMIVKKYLVLFVGIGLTQICLAQNYLDKQDTDYYEHWLGVWHKEGNGKVDKLPSFVVIQGLYKGSFEETWIGAGGSFSKAWRAWDERTKKWDFAWMSVDGLFQIWKGKKVNGIWYIHKRFKLENGEEVLSRQAFIPNGSNTIIRTSEHSQDNGTTWKLRFKEKYIKQK